MHKPSLYKYLKYSTRYFVVTRYFKNTLFLISTGYFYKSYNCVFLVQTIVQNTLLMYCYSMFGY